MPSKIHVLMKDAYDQDALQGLTVKDQMACRFDLPIASPRLARVTPKIGKIRQRSECFVKSQNIPLSARQPPSLDGKFCNPLDVGSGFAR
jgi:hypothetical protein